MESDGMPDSLGPFRYKGVPRNILRHVIVSGIDSVMGLMYP